MDSNVLQELKQRARLLQKAVQNQQPHSLDRVVKLRELQPFSSQELAENIQRKHCLAILSQELGFDNWKHAQGVLAGQAATDYGKLLYPQSCHGHWNIWFATLDEARSIRAEHGGYLLPYKKQFLVVDFDYIASLGLAHASHEWDCLERDWCHESGQSIRAALYAQLVQLNSAEVN